MSKTTKQIEFVEDTHTYLVNGCIVPSVSQIIADDTYKSIPPHILEVAAERGSKVHYSTELIDKGKKPKLEPYYAEYVVQYLLFLKWWNEEYNKPIKYENIEEVMGNEEFCGTLDRFAFVKYSPMIIDIKTTSKLYKEKIAIQLGGYAILKAQGMDYTPHEIDGGVIWLTRNKWEFVEIEPNVDGFLEKLEEWKARQDNGLDKQFTF